MLYWNDRTIKVLIFLFLLDAEYFTFNSLSRGTQYVYCLSQYSVEYFITHQFVETGYMVSVIFSHWLINKQKKKIPFIMNFLFSAFIPWNHQTSFPQLCTYHGGLGGGGVLSFHLLQKHYCPQSLELLISLGVSFLFIQVRGQGNVRINDFDCRVCKALFTWMGWLVERFCVSVSYSVRL